MTLPRALFVAGFALIAGCGSNPSGVADAGADGGQSVCTCATVTPCCDGCHMLDAGPVVCTPDSGMASDLGGGACGDASGACDDMGPDASDAGTPPADLGPAADLGGGGGCGPGNCPGCCQGDFCLAGSASSACGVGGGTCAACGGGVCAAGTCEACTASNCAGCCGPSGCEAGTHRTACGAGGESCTACDDYAGCTASVCTACDSSNCAGCCTFFGECVTGDQFSQCGAGGGACERCDWPESCDANVCTPRACSATAPTRGVDGSDDCGSAGRQYICDCPDNVAGCTGDGVCASYFETRWRIRVATVSFDPSIAYDPPSVPWDITTEPDPVVLLEAGNTTLLQTETVEGALYHEYDPPVGGVRGATGLPRLRVTLYDDDFPGLSQRLQCTFQLDEAEDVRARRLLCEHPDNDTYVELFVEPM